MKITHRVFLRAMASMTLTRALLLVPLVAALVAGSASTATARFGPSDATKLGTVWETNPARTAILLTDGTTLIVTLLSVVPPTYP